MNYNELEGTALYRAVKAWLSNNSGKDLGDFRKETGYSGPELQIKDKKTGRVGLRTRSTDVVREQRIQAQDQEYIKTLEKMGYSNQEAQERLTQSKAKVKNIRNQVTELNREFGKGSFTVGHLTAVEKSGGDFGRNVKLEIGKSKGEVRGNFSRSNVDEIPQNIKAALGIPSNGREAAIMDESGMFDLPLTPKDRQEIIRNPELADDIIGRRIQDVERGVTLDFLGGAVPQPAARPEEFESALRAFSNRAERRLGRGVFENVLDTTTDTYKQMIGSMQPFLNLSDDQKAALNLYGQDGKQYYAQLNRLLRAGDTGKLSNQELETLNYIKDNLTEALTSLQSEPSQVYRGVSGSQVADFEKLKVGDTFIDKGFGSYSNNESAARRFLSRDKPSTLISVSNSSARNITPVAEYSESEFLAKPNTQYSVKDIQETINKKTGKPIRHIILDEIAGPIDALLPGGASQQQLQDIISKRPNNPLAQTAVTSSIFQKAQQVTSDLKSLRRTATAAAVGGAALPAFLGTAASASELATRKAIQAQTNSPIDKLQTGIAGASLAADTASYVPILSVPAGIASAGLDVINTGIDVSRNLINEARKNQVLQNIYNTLR